MTSSADVTDWREVITDADGEVVSEAFETRRELLDSTITTGGFEGTTPQGHYESTYEDKTGRRVTEVHLGDEDYEYFFKDQVSGTSQTLTSTGQPEQKNRARIHNTLEYEILNKGTENETHREWIEQSYLRGMMIGTVVNPDGSGGVSSSSGSGRTRVGEYQSGGSGDFAEGSWATDPHATPQAVGGGTNPSSSDGPWGGQGGPSEGGGEGEGGEGGGEGGGGGTAGGNTSGSTVTDTTPWEYHEGDVIEGLPGQAIEEPLLWHKPRRTDQGQQRQIDETEKARQPGLLQQIYEGFWGSLPAGNRSQMVNALSDARASTAPAYDPQAAIVDRAQDDYNDRVVSDQTHMLDGIQAIIELTSSMVPGVGETMDAAVFTDAGSSGLERIFAGASLGLSVITAGFAPNFGGAARALTPSVTTATRYGDSAALRAVDDALVNLLRTQCFSRDTLVSTKTGLRPIGQIRIGDEVHSFDFASGTWQLRTVTERIDNTYDGMVITIQAGESRIEATVHHPFWVIAGEDLENRLVPVLLSPGEDQGQSLPGRWVNSHDLRVGDVVLGREGEHLSIQNVKQRYEAAFPVCNLTIGEYHNYAVGANAILVHNHTICATGQAALRDMLDEGIPFEYIVETTRGFKNQDEVLSFIVENSAVYHLHHAWPKYLGGPSKQDLVRLPKHVHDAYHSGLDKILPRRKTAAYYEELSDDAKRLLERDMADFTKAFDRRHGTSLWEAMINNGFPGG